METATAQLILEHLEGTADEFVGLPRPITLRHSAEAGYEVVHVDTRLGTYDVAVLDDDPGSWTAYGPRADMELGELIGEGTGHDARNAAVLVYDHLNTNWPG